MRFREFPSKQARDDYLNSLGLKTTQVTTDQGATGLLYQGEGPNSEWAGTLIFAFDDPDLETYDVAVSMDNGKDADAAAVIDRLPL